MSSATVTSDYNDHRAAHKVHVLAPQLGTCVQIPYRSYTISLAADGQSVVIFKEDYDHDMMDDGIYGTSGESVKAAMKHIDDIIDAD